MTVIAWDGKDLAGDKRMSYHNTPVTKVRRLSDGSVAGASGIANLCEAVFAWLEDKRPISVKGKLAQGDDVHILHVFADGHAEFWSRTEGAPITVYPPFAIGKGCDYAQGAMAAGATAVQAVEIASRYEGSCGDGVDVVTPINRCDVVEED